jgi:hypothetical protein
MYSIQHYVIKFVSDLRQVDGFTRVHRFPPPTNLTATMLRVECTLVCSLQSRVRSHAVLVICWFELLGNPTTYLIEPPGPFRHERDLNACIYSGDRH